MRPKDFIHAASVPASLTPQTFGPWTIERRTHDGVNAFLAGRRTHTILWRQSWRTIHLVGPGEVVMEDSVRELNKHMPIWLAARGRVLVTGLGLGCVVRGLLAKPEVEHIDVVEIDRHILRIVGREFAGHPRVTLHHGDALTIEFPRGTRWDYAWHDLWTDGDEHLQRLHVKLMTRFKDQLPSLERQGAWAWPREISRMAVVRLLGTKRLKPWRKSRAAARAAATVGMSG